MGFYASSFVWKNIPSEMFDVYLSTVETGAESKSSGSSRVNVITEKPYRKSTSYLLGVTQSDNLTFPIEVTSPVEIDAEKAEAIQRWMCGGVSGYSILQIEQPDMNLVYFNCIINNPQIIRVGNVIRGFTFDVECDSPWGWEFPKKFSYDATALSSLKINFYNSSDDNDYLYPKLSFTMGLSGDFSIVNTSDKNRTFTFTGLSTAEVITVDNYLQIIESSTGLNRLGNFNKKYFRLIPGMNILTISRTIPSLTLTCSFAKKIGG